MHTVGKKKTHGKKFDGNKTIAGATLKPFHTTSTTNCCRLKDDLFVGTVESLWMVLQKLPADNHNIDTAQVEREEFSGAKSGRKEKNEVTKSTTILSSVI